ncbi:MAG: rane protein [Chthoniobacteraceae bacterium]|nr:rane protein [Chthoniobacteraceae bacterium]
MPSTLFTLLDDIASVLDDVAVMTKIATKRTAGVLGDDLALNAQQVAGVNPDRELPVVWGVAKGSALNKAILVPAALAISWVAPWAITPLLMLGGAYLCFEGCEKLAHKFLHSKAEGDVEHQAHVQALADPSVDLATLERTKIKGAIRTDFILSAEIIVIALGTVAAAGFMRQLLVLATISIIMTVGVYGLVAGIVKLDDAGLYLNRRQGGARQLGRAILFAAPWLMKGLSWAGTVAMFMVGGGILVHGIPWLHHSIKHAVAAAGQVSVAGKLLGGLTSMILPALAGIVVGLIALGLVTAVQRIRGKKD